MLYKKQRARRRESMFDRINNRLFCCSRIYWIITQDKQHDLRSYNEGVSKKPICFGARRNKKTNLIVFSNSLSFVIQFSDL